MYVYVDFSFDTSVKQIFNDKLFKICLTNIFHCFPYKLMSATNCANKFPVELISIILVLRIYLFDKSFPIHFIIYPKKK